MGQITSYSNSACSSPSLSISTAYDQFNSQIKSEEDWKDGFSFSNMSSPAGSFANGMTSNNLSSASASATFTPPPFPISNIKNSFTNGTTSSAHTNMVSSPAGGFSNVSTTGGNMFQGGETSSSSMNQNSTYFESSNTSFSSDSHKSFNSECHCRPNYTCSKCFQKEMDM